MDYLDPTSWPWDRMGYSPIVDVEGRVIGCEIICEMSVEAIRKKYPNAVVKAKDVASSH